MRHPVILTTLLSMPLLTSCLVIVDNSASHGPHVEVERSIDSFSSLHLAGVANVVYRQADECSLRIEGDSASVSLVTTRVDESGTLIIDRDQRGSDETSGKVTIRITAPVIDNVKHLGVGSLQFEGPVALPSDLVVSSVGVGSVQIDSLACSHLLMKHTGVGSVTMHVESQTVRYTTSGVGASSVDVEADTVIVSSSGVGQLSLSGNVRSCYERGALSIVGKIDDSDLRHP